MPKGDRLKLKADPEDGTTPITNLLLEAVAMANLSGKEKGAILYLWRRTYGWQDRETGHRLTSEYIPLHKWASALCMRDEHVSKLLSSLTEKKVFKREFLGAGKGYTYSMNTNIATWNSHSIDLKALRESATLAESGNPPLAESGNPPLAESGNPPLQKVATNLQYGKETPIKETGKETLLKKGGYGGDLPDWIDKQTWTAYLEMRRDKKKPATAFAIKLIIKKLEKWRAAGQDVTAILNQSIIGTWTDVYEVKQEAANGTGREQGRGGAENAGGKGSSLSGDKATGGGIQGAERGASAASRHTWPWKVRRSGPEAEPDTAPQGEKTG